MKIWYDTEFLEDGRTIMPISVGMVREDGATLYAVNDKLLRPEDGVRLPPDHPYERVCRHDWLMKNVVPHLPLTSRDGRELTHRPRSGLGPAFFTLNPDDLTVLPLRMIKRMVREFVLEHPDPELWAWFGSYDHLFLCQLFGKMIDLPEGFPMHTNDIMTLVTQAGGRAPDEPKQRGDAHNALADAWHARTLHQFYTERLAEQAERRYQERHKQAFQGSWKDGERETIPVLELPSWEGR